jgi:hypothetical protein
MRAIHPVVALVLVLALALGHPGIAGALQAPEPADESTADDRTPPRLSYVDGQVSFWRPGAPEWVAAQINTALAPGDDLSTGSPGNFEIQIGTRAYVRAWAGTGLGLVNQEPDFLQMKVTAGHASLDLRALDSGRTVEVDTPNAAFTIEHPGYYRVQVNGDRTSFISRRGGRAIVTPANGQAATIAASEEVVVEGTDAPRVASYAAPPLDEWDRWNYARTDYLADAVSARYVPPGVYGASDLDRHGRWRVVSDYGPVWVPTAVPSGWVPYSTGAWTWDPYYGWTWVDTAPWGWAPFHYGRWVFVDRYWAWAPGPLVVRPAYAPALVAFFGGGPSVSVRIGWVALGWGEPLIPWWGRPRFVGVPWWGGWGGPRVVNNVVINRTTVVNVQNITVYRNVGVRNAVVAVEHQRFGRGHIGSARLAAAETRGLEPVRGRLEIKPVPASLAPTTARGVRPPDQRQARPVVATRPPQPRPDSPVVERGVRSPATAAPAPRLVPAPRQPDAGVASPRPPIGQGRSERPTPPPAPRFGGAERPSRATPSEGVRSAPPAASRGGESRPSVAPQTPSTRTEAPRPQAPPKVEAPRPRTPSRTEAPRPQTAPQVEAPRPQTAPRMEAPRPQAPPRVEAPRPQTVPRTEAPRLQTAPRIEAPRPQAPPRAQAPRPQATPRMDAPRPQARQLPGQAADRMSPGRGPRGEPGSRTGGESPARSPGR